MKARTRPYTTAQFDGKRDQFTAWLSGRGSEILAPTNPFEVLRFTGPANTCVIYRNGKNNITNWANGADQAWDAFAADGPWRACERGTRNRRTDARVKTLADRDGWSCLYCGTDMTIETATLEHIVPLTCGGPDHIANLALAHEACNRAAGHLSAREKFEMALKRRMP